MGLLSFLLTGCRPFHIMDGPGMEYKGGDNVSAKGPGPESVGEFNGTVKQAVQDGEDDPPS